MKMKVLLALEGTTIAQPLDDEFIPNSQDILFLHAKTSHWSSEDVPGRQSRRPGAIVEADQWYLKIKKTELLTLMKLIQED